MALRQPSIFSGAIRLPWIVLAVAFCVAAATAAAAQQTQVAARVETVARVSGPDAVTVDPGESRAVTVRVAANFAWRLVVETGNPSITATIKRPAGRPGGYAAPGNTVQVLIACEPSAPGRQSASLAYSLARK